VRRWDYATDEDACMWAFDNGRWVRYEDAAALKAAADRLAEAISPLLDRSCAETDAWRGTVEWDTREPVARLEWEVSKALAAYREVAGEQ